MAVILATLCEFIVRKRKKEKGVLMTNKILKHVQPRETKYEIISKKPRKTSQIKL